MLSASTPSICKSCQLWQPSVVSANHLVVQLSLPNIADSTARRMPITTRPKSWDEDMAKKRQLAAYEQLCVETKRYAKRPQPPLQALAIKFSIGQRQCQCQCSVADRDIDILDNSGHAAG